ncbi:MAG: hypothetical protein LBV22_01075 [Mycoplasmataceae bacterium]|jgi:aspartyl/glutamyl-tRNA(Asn/Gln) amidotransferase C subunit|nr:hypothetical protein [Mycoplasmataceae bacterium]
MVSKETIKNLANSLYFDMSDIQIECLCAEFDSLQQALQELNSINVDNVAPTSYVFNTSSNDLREDVANPNAVSTTSYTTNVPNFDEPYIIVNKENK